MMPRASCMILASCTDVGGVDPFVEIPVDMRSQITTLLVSMILLQQEAIP